MAQPLVEKYRAWSIGSFEVLRWMNEYQRWMNEYQRWMNEYQRWMNAYQRLMNPVLTLPCSLIPHSPAY
ncbi:hypothetical protein [Nostoc sp.]|uniref:hypothetical protein n=1 Tax=Nostoc sp. TaxID=1180 RepID=UPI002FF6AF30